MVALDGTKVAADAALDRNRDADWIRREVSKLMAATAEEEQGASVDAAAGLPGLEQAGEISGARGRVARLQAALAVIEAEDAAAAAEAAKTAQAATAEAEQGRASCGVARSTPSACCSKPYSLTLTGRWSVSASSRAGAGGEGYESTV
jgi:hypothetical protein